MKESEEYLDRWDGGSAKGTFECPVCGRAYPHTGSTHEEDIAAVKRITQWLEINGAERLKSRILGLLDGYRVANAASDTPKIQEAGSRPSAPAPSGEPLPKLKAGHMGNEIDISDWPDCAVLGCRNKSCLALDSAKCHPHTLLERMESSPVDLQGAARTIMLKHGVELGQKVPAVFAKSEKIAVIELLVKFGEHLREGR